MKTSPKLLPWLARKAGLSQEKAEVLWHETFAKESLTTQYANNPDAFLRRVLEYFQQVAAQQNAQRDSIPSRMMAPQGSASKSNHCSSNPVAVGLALA